MIRSTGSDVLLSAGNFALRHSPVPQILLSRNALYTCRDFYDDLRRRGEYRMWLDTWLKGRLARRSVKTADAAVAPSRAFAEELQHWTGKKVHAIHHGFDVEFFTADQRGLDPEINAKLSAAGAGTRLLFVSHYNYYRNFETIIRALGSAVQQSEGARLQLVFTCALRAGENPGSYRPEAAARLVEQLGLRSNVIELGRVRYSQLHHLYKACDIYVTAAYCESFAHPLVEAMSSGLPVIASDISVHRGICEDAAVYFPRFSDSALSQQICELAGSSEKRDKLAAQGRTRAAMFSWKDHVDKMVQLAKDLMRGSR
jgi:glycosyltransferase involved in cell wall biosynthesis